MATEQYAYCSDAITDNVIIYDGEIDLKAFAEAVNRNGTFRIDIAPQITDCVK